MDFGIHELKYHIKKVFKKSSKKSYLKILILAIICKIIGIIKYSQLRRITFMSISHFYQCRLTLISVQFILHLFLILKTRKR